MSNTKDARGISTKQSIVNIMFKKLEKKCFNQITVHEICEAAYISRTTFYLHFEDKYHLMEYCIEILLEPMMKHLKNGDALNAYKILLHAIHLQLPAMKNLLHFEKNLELECRINAMLLQTMIAYFQNLKDQEIVQNTPVELLAVYHRAGVSDLITWWVINDIPISEEQLLKHILHNLK